MRTIGKRRRKLPGAAQLSSKMMATCPFDGGSISQHVWTVPISDPANDSGSATHSERGFRVARTAMNRNTPADKVIDVYDERFHDHPRTGEPLSRLFGGWSSSASRNNASMRGQSASRYQATPSTMPGLWSFSVAAFSLRSLHFRY